MRILSFYMAAVNIAAFLAMGIDKYRAQRHKWRISEASLFILGLAGGGIGAFAGMGMFHHKTKHLKFTLGIPLITILNIIMFGYLLQRFGQL